MTNFFKRQQGFALLYTVIIVSLILTIAISISTISYKQGILSSLAKDSQIAFYQADAGAECAIYHDVVSQAFVIGVAAPEMLVCGAYDIKIDNDLSSDGYYFYNEITDTSDPCFSILVDKVTEPGVTIVEARGHNICEVNPRQVERAVQVKY